uniref:Uncharacterized protein n=1 Tax=Chromera velia CCMP2878 TaxID=1169474 RepID=A0A0G4FZE4_9ALVE|eukprot:Cvel_19391.t1-p1 / transcript=Cvel_19391.t1 / gene=Cvel_19391 / organism=Chromera_velia_CCMP2878 / gene_product=hypothetical protein / transcript_product=hypothetical protein / location=Cvel_scaffold1668:10850-13351(+) / protein_length=516 / sequence_SO=supercontig / SO=protein_coding / is_pseudo=false
MSAERIRCSRNGDSSRTASQSAASSFGKARRVEFDEQLKVANEEITKTVSKLVARIENAFKEPEKEEAETEGEEASTEKKPTPLERSVIARVSSSFDAKKQHESHLLHRSSVLSRASKTLILKKLPQFREIHEHRAAASTGPSLLQMKTEANAQVKAVQYVVGSALPSYDVPVGMIKAFYQRHYEEIELLRQLRAELRRVTQTTLYELGRVGEIETMSYDLTQKEKDNLLDYIRFQLTKTENAGKKSPSLADEADWKVQRFRELDQQHAPSADLEEKRQQEAEKAFEEEKQEAAGIPGAAAESEEEPPEYQADEVKPPDESEEAQAASGDKLELGSSDEADDGILSTFRQENKKGMALIQTKSEHHAPHPVEVAGEAALANKMAKMYGKNKQLTFRLNATGSYPDIAELVNDQMRRTDDAENLIRAKFLDMVVRLSKAQTEMVVNALHSATNAILSKMASRIENAKEEEAARKLSPGGTRYARTALFEPNIDDLNDYIKSVQFFVCLLRPRQNDLI